MIKSKLLKFITLVAGPALGGVAHAAGGDIYEIRPCTMDGTAREPYATIDAPLTSGETVYFMVRLIQRQRDVDSSIWKVESAFNPPQIGIYVSGQLCWATLIDWSADRTTGFTDLIFKYKTRAGDFALPITLAVDGDDGKVRPATDGDVNGETTYHLNSATASKWSITNGAGQTANLWFWSTSWPVTPPDGERRLDYSLSLCGFHVQTVDFDSAWEVAPGMEGTPNGIWRSVHQGSTITVGGTPSLVATAPVENATTLYVWSTDDTAVKIRGGKLVTDFVTSYSVDGTPVVTSTRVGTVTLAGGQMRTDFQIEGVTGGGASCNLVLSSWDHYNFSMTYDRIIDYKTVPVKCIEPMPISINIECDATTVYARTVADEGYLESVTRLSIYPTQAPLNDITVTVKPVFQTDDTKTDWGDYVRFSTDDVVGTLPEATLPTVTFLKGSTERKCLYVYALRSESAYTYGYGHQLRFKLTADADAMKAANVASFGETGIYIDANKPVIASPTAETSLSARAGENLPLNIAINDIYADVTDLETGYAVEVTFNGQAQAQNTTFVPIGSDGFKLVGKDDYTIRPKIEIPVTLSAGEYTASVKVTSPIHKKVSDEVKFNVVVEEARRAAIELTDGRDEIIEGERVRFKVTLDDAPTEDLYAFLVDYDDTPDGMFSGASARAIIRKSDLTTAIATSRGLCINQYTTAASGSFTLQDGVSEQEGGSIYNFGVVFCKKPVWDPAEQVSSFLCTYPLTLWVFNKEPTFDVNEPVYVNGFPVKNGGTLDNEYPKGQILEIRPNINDVGFDLKHGFKWKYIVSRNGISVETGTVGHEDTDQFQPRADVTIDDGTDINFGALTNINFGTVGLYTITIKLQDKDMCTGSVNEYAQDVLSFNINIVNPSQTQTQTTAVPVPYAWLLEKFPETADEYEAYERLAKSTAANPAYTVMDCYVVGLDPRSPTDEFRINIEMDADGKPIVTWEPELEPAEAAKRVYTVYGKESLEKGGWVDVSTLSEAEKDRCRFFKVGVWMRKD